MKKCLQIMLCLIAINFLGCTKDDKIVIKKKQGSLINKKWQLTGITLKTSIGNLTNEYDSLPSFRKDDYFIFKVDSTYEFNDYIDTMPGKHSKILDAGTWKLDSKQTQLEMHSDLFNTNYTPAKILELSTTRLSLERTSAGDGSVSVTTYKSL